MGADRRSHAKSSIAREFVDRSPRERNRRRTHVAHRAACTHQRSARTLVART
jgi:hypothetical protein